MISQTRPTDLYRHRVTLVNTVTEQEVNFTVSTLTDRFVDVLNAIRDQREAMRLPGRYELFECLPLN